MRYSCCYPCNLDCVITLYSIQHMNKLEMVLFNIRYIAEKLGDNPSKADLIRYQKELYKECQKLEVIIKKE